MGSVEQDFREVMRMIECERNPKPDQPDLLTALLNGFPRDVTHVQKIRAFARRYLGLKDRIVEVCDAFLIENDAPPPPEPKGCALDEFPD